LFPKRGFPLKEGLSFLRNEGLATEDFQKTGIPEECLGKAFFGENFEL